MVLWSHCLQGQTLSNKMAHFFCNKTNLNEQLKSILGSQIICINICTSLAKSHMNCFVTKGNARFDFSFPWILTYTWLKITFVWNPIYFCFLCINTHTHTQTYIIMYICVYIRICILMARSFKSRQNVFLVLSTSQLYHTDGFLWKEGYT